MGKIEFNKKHMAIRWLGYFDLLGTKKIISTNNHLSVFSVYGNAIEQFKNMKNTIPDIQPLWFSDTFMIYSEDMSINGFGEVSHIASWVCYDLIMKGIPVRGSISYGEFYADKDNSLFFGKPLIEAYEYGEAQDWLGFILCPSVENILISQGFFSDQSSAYVYSNIPYKKVLCNKSKLKLKRNLPACILGCWLPIDYQSDFLKKLNQMKVDNSKYKRKYRNTIDFINKNKRTVTL